MSQFFTSGGQSIGVSASALVLSINIQDWFPLGLTGWISLQSKRLSRVFSNSTVQEHQFFNALQSLISVSSLVLVTQLCPTLRDPVGHSPAGSSVHEILQARILEWVAISFSNAGKWKVKVKSLSRVRPSATPWTAAFQAPPSMGFSKQEYSSFSFSISPSKEHQDWSPLEWTGWISLQSKGLSRVFSNTTVQKHQFLD